MEHNYKICPACDFFCNKLEKKLFCPKCGAKLIDKCQNCEKPINFPYAEFCSNCGNHYRKNDKINNLKEIK